MSRFASFNWLTGLWNLTCIHSTRINLRSFCGKNATMYGKGVYFARDASYSAHPLYSVPDRKGIQYIMACRVVVGEYCQGVKDALTPEVRDPNTHSLFDSTVGVLTNDTMANPSIYVTYHDAQAYPEVSFALANIARYCIGVSVEVSLIN